MSDSIGARLRQARELRRLTLLQVSESTRVRAHYLQALETDDYSAIPSAAQARGFLRIYTEFLELDQADLFSSVTTAVAPSTPEAPVELAPLPLEPARPSLWAGLRDRLARHSGKIKEAPSASSPDVAPEAVQPAPVPASADAQTTPHAASAPADVKKNAAR